MTLPTLRRALSGPGRAAALCLAAALSGCAALPSHGPSLRDVRLAAEAEGGPAPFLMVELDQALAETLGRTEPASLAAALDVAPARARVISVGDALRITVWEPSPDGLFSTAENKRTEILETVDLSGRIYMPYVGALQVRGRDPAEVRTAIEAGLQGKAVDPQVQVALMGGDGGDDVTVLGDVKAAGRFPSPSSGMRLADAVAMAGGAAGATRDAEIRVLRGGRVGTARLSDVIARPEDNIVLMPRDTVQVMDRPRRYHAFGALGRQVSVPMPQERMTMAEALAQAGGLQDLVADSEGLLLFRMESPERVGDLPGAARAPRYAAGVPTVYRVDFSRPEAFFIASAFEIRDGDALYAASAPASELRKIMTIILTPTLSSAQSTYRLGD